MNKWDLVEKDQNTMNKVEEMIRERTSPFTDIPIVFTSNVKKQRVLKALETAPRFVSAYRRCPRVS